MKPGDYLYWGERPNVHIWLVRGVYLGGAGQESLIEVENVSHKPGEHVVGTASFGSHVITEETMFIPECLVRGLRCGSEVPAHSDT